MDVCRMKKRHAAAGIAAALCTYLLVHAAGGGYAFYLLHGLANDPVGAANPYVAGAQADHDLFLLVFAVTSLLTLLCAAALVGLLKQAVWGRHLWLATTVVLLGSCAVATLHLQVSWGEYAFPLLASALGWWCLLTTDEKAHAG